MLKRIIDFFTRPKQRIPEFDGRLSEIDSRSSRIQELLQSISAWGDPQKAITILKVIDQRMNAAINLARFGSHDALMQAHQESVETETLILAWADRYRPRPTSDQEKKRLQKTYVEILGFIAVLRLEFTDAELPGTPLIDDKEVFVPISNGHQSGPFCKECYTKNKKLFLLAQSPTPDVHMKCPCCELK